MLFRSKDGKVTREEVYDGDGNTVRTDVPESSGRVSTYGPDGRKTGEEWTDPGTGETTARIYDKDGKVTREEVYDGDGNIVGDMTTHADGTRTANKYDKNGSITEQRILDKNGNVIS